MTTTELTETSKSRRAGKIINFLVVFVNRDLGPRHYQMKADNDEQIDEYLSAIRNENEYIDYIRY